MGGAACVAVARREALIAAGSFTRQGRAGVVLGATEGPLAVQGPHQGHGQAADFLDREGAITQPVQVHQINLSLVLALLHFGARACG